MWKKAVKGEERGREIRGEGRDMEEKIKEMENRIGRKKREERRKNIMIKEMKLTEGKKRKAVEEILKDIGHRSEGQNRRDKENEKERREGNGIHMGWRVWLENEEQRREVSERKRNLKGRNERIVEDLIWKERKIMWKLEDIAKEDRKKGVGRI